MANKSNHCAGWWWRRWCENSNCFEFEYKWSYVRLHRKMPMYNLYGIWMRVVSPKPIHCFVRFYWSERNLHCLAIYLAQDGIKCETCYNKIVTVLKNFQNKTISNAVLWQKMRQQFADCVMQTNWKLSVQSIKAIFMNCAYSVLSKQCFAHRFSFETMTFASLNVTKNVCYFWRMPKWGGGGGEWDEWGGREKKSGQITWE